MIAHGGGGLKTQTGPSDAKTHVLSTRPVIFSVPLSLDWLCQSPSSLLGTWKYKNSGLTPDENTELLKLGLSNLFLQVL